MKDLMTVFTASVTTMDNRERTIAVIKFMRLALMKSGHEASRIFVSGYLNEALLAAETHMTVNPVAQGVDAVDSDNKPHEFKICNAKLGKKANVNLSGPQKKTGEVRDVYYERLRETFVAKGEVLIKHIYDVDATGEEKANVYSFSPEFIAMYMDYNNSWIKDNTNIGGVGCPKCTKIHRLLKYKQYEQLYLADPPNFNKTVLAIKVSSQTDCDKL